MQNQTLQSEYSYYHLYNRNAAFCFNRAKSRQDQPRIAVEAATKDLSLGRFAWREKISIHLEPQEVFSLLKCLITKESRVDFTHGMNEKEKKVLAIRIKDNKNYGSIITSSRRINIVFLDGVKVELFNYLFSEYCFMHPSLTKELISHQLLKR